MSALKTGIRTVIALFLIVLSAQAQTVDESQLKNLQFRAIGPASLTMFSTSPPVLAISSKSDTRPAREPRSILDVHLLRVRPCVK
jgi:hypothetical protein